MKWYMAYVIAAMESFFLVALDKKGNQSDYELWGNYNKISGKRKGERKNINAIWFQYVRAVSNLIKVL